MNCPNCGSQNSDSSKFCIHCGHALPVRTEAERSAPQSEKTVAANRAEASSEVIADRADQAAEIETPAVSVSAPEADAFESSAERTAPGESADSVGNSEDNAEDVRSAEAEVRESFSGKCPPAPDGEMTASADAPNEEAFAARNVTGNSETLPNAQSAAPYKDAPAASYTAPSGNLPYTASVSAGAPDAPGAGNGAAAFAPPSYAAHAPNPYMKAESLRMSKLAALKAAVVSPSYLIAAIASTLVFLLIVFQTFIPGMSVSASNTARLQEVLDSAEISFSLNSFVITASVIAALPSFLLALGMWLGFFSCRTKKNRVSTAGFTIHQVLLCVALVFLCIFYLMLILAFVFIIIGIVSGAGVDITSELSPELRSMGTSALSFIIYAAIFVSVAVMTLYTVWLARLIVTVSSIKAIARAYDTKARISGYAAGMCIVAAILLILSAAGYSLLRVFSLAVPEILNAVFLLSLGVFIFSLKRKVNAAVDEVENYFDGASYAYANVPNGYAAYGTAQAAPAPRYSTPVVPTASAAPAAPQAAKAAAASPAAPVKAPAEAVKPAETKVPASPAASPAEAPVGNPAPEAVSEQLRSNTSHAKDVGNVPQTESAAPAAVPTEEKRASSPYIQIERNR